MFFFGVCKSVVNSRWFIIVNNCSILGVNGPGVHCLKFVGRKLKFVNVMYCNDVDVDVDVV